MKENEFIKYCERNICLLSKLKSKKCKTREKQEKCFWISKNKELKSPKGKRKLSLKNQTDPLWDDVREKVWLRDAGFFTGQTVFENWKEYCKLWNILRYEEKKHITHHFKNGLWVGKFLDPAHIDGKGAYPEHKYRVDNVVLVSRYFHDLLDQMKHPVYKTTINLEERQGWLLSALLGKRLEITKKKS